MSCIVPSQVVTFIDKLFPALKNQEDMKGKGITLDYHHFYSVNAIVGLVEQIPPELIILDPDDYIAYAASLSAARSALQMWAARGNTSTGNLEKIPGLSRLNPITIIRRLLRNAPMNSRVHLYRICFLSLTLILEKA